MNDQSPQTMTHADAWWRGAAMAVLNATNRLLGNYIATK